MFGVTTAASVEVFVTVGYLDIAKRWSKGMSRKPGGWHHIRKVDSQAKARCVDFRLLIAASSLKVGTFKKRNRAEYIYSVRHPFVLFLLPGNLNPQVGISFYYISTRQLKFFGDLSRITIYTFGPLIVQLNNF